MMKIGILQCDSVLQQYQSRFGDYPDMFQNLLQYSGQVYRFEIYPVLQGIYPKHINDCDAYITTGSKDSVYDPLPWLNDFKDFIRLTNDSDTKLVAICFGHQLVAETFHGLTQKSDKGWGVGVAQNRIVEQALWMQPDLDQLNLIVSHRDQVVRLPDQAVLLASSDFCPNFMYQMDNILSIQGHPEFSKPYAETMMRHRRDKLGESVYQAGHNSLSMEVHDHTVARWIDNFIRQG